MITTVLVDPDCRAAHKHQSCAGGACGCPCHLGPGSVNPRAAHFVHHGFGWKGSAFQSWVDAQWREFWADQGVRWVSEQTRPRATEQDHLAFDAWLERRCPLCGRASADSQPYPRGAEPGSSADLSPPS